MKYDFCDGNGPVPAHKHKNGGGIVKDTVNVPEGVYVGPKATICCGTIRGGNICGGNICGGTIWGGTIWGGTIWGGDIWGGTIWGGDIKRNEDILFLSGPFNYLLTLVRQKDGEWFMGYGCEWHNVKEWPKLHVPLSKKHNAPNEAKSTRYCLKLCQDHIKRYKEIVS